MVDPQDITVQLKEFQYDCLKAGEKLFIEMQIDLENLNISKINQDYMVLMFRIVDNTNTILGDSKED